MNMCAPTPYNKTNKASEKACAKGGRKPIFSVGLERSDVGKMKEIWNQWVSYTAEHENANRSIVLLESYGYGKVHEVAVEETAYPHRNCHYHLVARMEYSDSALDGAVKKYGDKVREILHVEKNNV